MSIEKKDVHAKEIMGLLQAGGNVTIKGEVSAPLEVEFCVHPVYGSVFRIDNSIYFLKAWPDQGVIDFYEGLGDLLWGELSKRGLGGEDGGNKVI